MTKRERQSAVSLLVGLSLGQLLAMAAGIIAMFARDVVEGTHGRTDPFIGYVALGYGLNACLAMLVAGRVVKPLARQRAKSGG